MKRSPLKRNSRLKRGGWLKRGRRKPGGVVADVWREDLAGEACVVCGIRGYLDGHHAIPRRVLIWHHLEAHLNDTRNRVPVCRHDHESHENAARRIKRAELPIAVFQFARDVGLVWYLDKHYPLEASALCACGCGHLASDLEGQLLDEKHCELYPKDCPVHPIGSRA